MAFFSLAAPKSVPTPEAIDAHADSLDIGRDSGLQTMGKPMDAPVPVEEARPTRLAGLAALNNPRFVASLYAGMLALQAVGYLIMGIGRAGTGFSQLILCFHALLAIICVSVAFRRARGTDALFWFLFVVTLLCLLVPSALWAMSTILNFNLVSSSTWRVLFCLYGAPILMMLFLPETDQRGRQWSQIFLDQFQIAVVVGLAYSTFFYLPLQHLLPSDALIRNLIVSNLQSLSLLVAVLVRLQFAHTASSRSLLQRLGVFVLCCATVTLIGNWIDLHGHTTASAWFDLGWAFSYPPAAFAAIYWRPEPEAESASQPTNFLSIVGTNLVLVAVLLCLILMLDAWKRAHGALNERGIRRLFDRFHSSPGFDAIRPATGDRPAESRAGGGLSRQPDHQRPARRGAHRNQRRHANQ